MDSGDIPLIFEKNRPGRTPPRLPGAGKSGPSDPARWIPKKFLREKPPALPLVEEPEVVRHYTHLSRLNYSVDTHFYPLGSCTMKHNPKVNDRIAAMPGFTDLHPFQPPEGMRGLFQILRELERYLCEIAGMDVFSLQPAAGAQAEFLGLLVCRAYHRKRGEAGRNRVLVPDSAHGTNPASAAMAGMEVVQIRSGSDGCVDIEDLRRHLDRRVACLMLTNPNTLGLFEKNIGEISRLVHNTGGLLYCDGANLNALLGICRPGDMGFDLVHLNLHKTFSTPHGSGGPGAGPLGVKRFLAPFLRRFRVRSFYGNIPVLIRAWAYIRSLGPEGLAAASRRAVLHANYLLAKLRDRLPPAFGDRCLHEFVISLKNSGGTGGATAAAKQLLDAGFYAPTVNFPTIVPECLMVEPTETESKETLDRFAEALREIAGRIGRRDESAAEAPTSTPVGRLDEVAAARNPVLRWNP